jgi:uncharacterized protein
VRRRRRTSALVLAALVASTLPTLSATAVAQEPDSSDGGVVISQVYGGGGNSGARYRNDFVELFNRGEAEQSIDGWSIQYTSANGNSWGNQTTTVSGTVEPGKRYLVQLGAGANTDAQALPEPDATGSTNMSATNGKVALVASADALPPETCPTGDTVVDAVGFGTQNCAAIGATDSLANDAAALRDDDRCADGFSIVSPPEPENSAAPAAPCDGSGNRPIATGCPALTVDQGSTGETELSATDPDGTVTEAALAEDALDEATLDDVTPAGAVGEALTATLAVDATELAFGSYEVTVAFTNDDDEPQTASCTVEVTVVFAGDLCEPDADDVTVINEIQGEGAQTPLEGQQVITRGVVTSDFTSGGETGIPANQGLRGFHIEAITADRDDDPATSEGLFVFDAAGTFEPELGTLVHVLGEAGEAFDVTQVDADGIEVCDNEPGALPPPAELPLPTPVDERDVVFERLESMRVVHDELTLVEFFQLERFGEVRLSSDGVLQNPTNVVDPDDDEAYEALVASNAANNIVLDDGRSGQNLDPLPYLEPGDTLRIGDTISDVPTIMHFGFGQWRLQPVDIDAVTEAFQDGRTRPRPQTPPTVGGSLTVAAFNVLNYFNGDGFFVGDDPETAEGFPTARGAVTPSEFERQTEKIVDAIVRMDADVVGLIEIENDEGEDQAAAALVDALNTELEAKVYDYIDTGVIGTDAIKLAYIYQPETVAPVGDHALLDSSVDERFDDQRSRPVLAQTFEELATGETVTVANNHLKSKGSGCGAGDDDPRQGSCNLTRTRAAEAMVDWLADEPTGVEATGTLIIGDLNSYAKEDPIVALQDGGYTDLLDAFAPAGTTPYTYTFDATQGYLDHALADAELEPFVTGTEAWNINADEVPAIDYLESCCGVSFNQRFRTEAVARDFYDPSAFRSSDHDPVIVGLDLTTPRPDPVLECPPHHGVDFPDVGPGNVHRGAIRCGNALGLVKGLADGRFDPAGSLTRGQAATIIDRLANAANRPIDGPRQGFPDVATDHQHADAITRLAGAGVINGFLDGTFRPNAAVERAQLASLLIRYIEEATGETLEQGARFPDVPAESTHDIALRKARAADIVRGDDAGNANPSDSIQRDQAASLFVRSLPAIPLGD